MEMGRIMGSRPTCGRGRGRSASPPPPGPPRFEGHKLTVYLGWPVRPTRLPLENTSPHLTSPRIQSLSCFVSFCFFLPISCSTLSSSCFIFLDSKSALLCPTSLRRPTSVLPRQCSLDAYHRVSSSLYLYSCPPLSTRSCRGNRANLVEHQNIPSYHYAAPVPTESQSRLTILETSAPLGFIHMPIQL